MTEEWLNHVEKDATEALGALSMADYVIPLVAEVRGLRELLRGAKAAFQVFANRDATPEWDIVKRIDAAIGKESE